MRKAFIAAPLIGTLIFLTAIVFVVNINKAETSRVQEITADAYHNRIVSLLELYRVDLGSLFRESMSRLIENALANPGWSLFDVPFSTSGHPELKEPERTQQNRFESCTQVSEVIDAIICAKTVNNFACNGADQPSCEGVNQQNPCKWDSNTFTCAFNSAAGGQTYGLQQWLTNLQKPGIFEGISFGPANERNFEDFINPKNPDGSINTNKYSTNCRALVPGSLFDCVNFAKNNTEPLRCCAKYILTDPLTGQKTTIDASQRETSLWPSTRSSLKDYDCASDGVVRGCEGGTFFVQIIVQDARVFPNLPRLQAYDEGGNQIRSGAISDENFQLPIKYPIYKYMDASFRLYDRMAYGKRGTAYAKNEVDWTPSVQASSNGIVSGICGGVNCATLPIPSSATKPSTFNQPGKQTVDEANADIESLLGESLASVFDRYPELVFNFTELTPVVSCSKSAPCDLTPLRNKINWNTGDCDPNNPGPQCFWLESVTLRSFIIDETPAFRVNMSTPNAYNWGMTLKATGVDVH